MLYNPNLLCRLSHYVPWWPHLWWCVMKHLWCLTNISSSTNQNPSSPVCPSAQPCRRAPPGQLLELIYGFCQTKNMIPCLYKVYVNDVEKKSHCLLTCFMYKVQGLWTFLIIILTDCHSQRYFRGPLKAPFCDYFL